MAKNEKYIIKQFQLLMALLLLYLLIYPFTKIIRNTQNENAGILIIVLWVAVGFATIAVAGILKLNWDNKKISKNLESQNPS